MPFGKNIDTTKFITQAEALSLLEYRPSTGTLRWRKRGESMFKTERDRHIWNTRYAGENAGHYEHYEPIGRWIITINDRRYQTSHVIVLMQTGKWPEKRIYLDDQARYRLPWSRLKAVL